MNSNYWYSIKLAISFLFLPLFLKSQVKVEVEQCQQFLANIPINCLLADRSDMTWAGTNTGLYVFNNYEGVRTIHEEGKVTAMVMEESGYVWTSLASGEIVRSDKETRFFVDPTKNITITSLTLINSHLWIGTSKNGVYVWNIKKMSQIEHYERNNSELRSNDIFFIAKNSNNSIWIGTSLGVCEIKNNIWKTHKPSESFTAITFQEDNTWMIGSKNLWKINNDKWEKILIGSGIKKGNVRSMTIDKKGRLFLASGILSRYDPQNDIVKIFDKKDGYTNDESTQVKIDNEGNIWTGTRSKGLFQFKTILIERPFTMEQVFFESDSIHFTNSSLKELNLILSYLQEDPTLKIEIGGHTNHLPNEEYCDWLSTWRAKNIAEYFYSKGISKEQVTYVGYGKRKPIASNETEKGRQKNQRVEIQLRK